MPVGEQDGETILDVRDAQRRFGDRVALDGANLSLRPGQTHALLGPNGAGKTSLLQAISGRLALDSGSIVLDGGDPRSSPDARRSLGVVPQAIALYPHLTGRENLEVFGRLSGLAGPALTQAVGQALARIGLTERSDSRTSTLSGGMQRRLNIAAGILHRPKVLLLDEPTVGVDPQARLQIHQLLADLRDGGVAILITTHDLEQAETIADRVAILMDGRICADGTPEALVREYFGDAKQLTVTLSDEPSERGRALLEAEGLESVRGRRGWTGRLRGGLEHLSDLGERMSAAELAVAEVRIREPGLQGVYFRLTGEDLDP